MTDATGTKMIVGKSFCSFTMRAVQAMPDASVIYLDRKIDGLVIHQKLKQAFNQTTVPYIFINDIFVGGYDDWRATRLK